MASVIFAPSTLYGARQAPGATALIKNGLRSFTTPSVAGKRRREAHLGHHLCCFSYQSGTTRSIASNLEKVKIERNGDGKIEFDVYVVGEKGAPGIVVVQEWWGVDYEIKKHAINIASKGYRALIPDLYRGKLGLEVAEAQHLLEGLDWPGAVADIAASAKWLKDQGSSKVGVTGFCMGGGLTIASAVRVPGIDAVVAFYGTPPPQLADPVEAKVPVQAHFGENDTLKGLSDKETAKALEEKLKKANVSSEVYLYPNVGHAFMNSSPEAIERKKATGFGEHHQEAVDLAWSRFDLWFKKYLQVGK